MECMWQEAVEFSQEIASALVQLILQYPVLWTYGCVVTRNAHNAICKGHIPHLSHQHVLAPSEPSTCYRCEEVSRLNDVQY